MLTEADDDLELLLSELLRQPAERRTAELERVIAAHPSVALVAVGPRKDDVKGEIAKAYVVLRDGAVGDAEDIIAFCRRELAAYKVPREVQFVPDLPKTSTGKVMRRELHTLDAD